MTNVQAGITILIMAVVTILLRAAPFILFPKGKETPKVIIYLGKVLPNAIIALLVVYCFKEIDMSTFPFGMAEVIAALIVVFSYLCFKNSMLSIGLGTIVYMILVQRVFI